MSEDDIDKLLSYATENQKRALEAWRKHGSYRSAARELDVSHDTVRKLIKRVKRYAASRGWSPAHDLTKPAPDGVGWKGASIYHRAEYDESGKITKPAQWQKYKAEGEDKILAVTQACEQAFDRMLVAPPSCPPEVKTDANRMNVIPIGDMHLNMYADREMAGEDWDLAKGCDILVAGVAKAVSLMDPGALGVLINVGDFFHADDRSNRTRRSGHELEVDKDWAIGLRAGVEVLVQATNMMLAKHDRVHLINAMGNHDDHSSYALSLALAHHFHLDERVTVELSAGRFHYLEWGVSFLGVTHGDRGSPKPEGLGPVMACDKPQEWARCTERFWYTGHVHHDQTKDYAGFRFMSFRTLIPTDAHHWGKGYRSGRGIKVHVFDKEEGMLNEHSIGVKSLNKR